MYEPTAFEVSEGLAKIKKARALFFSAKAALAVGSCEDAEQYARTAIHVYASAMNWLEEGADGFDLAHTEIHDVGLYCRLMFPSGCRFKTQGTGFIQQCPLPLAHKRFGFSLSMTGNAICSICDTDVTECSHYPGHAYIIETRRHSGGRCNICGNERCETHVVGICYMACAFVIISKVYEMDEISLVSRPRIPDARLASISRSRDEVEHALGHPIPANGYLQCNKCLIPCDGFAYLPDSEMSGADK